MKMPKVISKTPQEVLQMVNKRFANSSVPRIEKSFSYLEDTIDMFSRNMKNEEACANKYIMNFYSNQKTVKLNVFSKIFGPEYFGELPRKSPKYKQIMRFMKQEGVDEETLKNLKKSAKDSTSFFTDLFYVSNNPFSATNELLEKRFVNVKKGNLQRLQQMEELNEKECRIQYGIIRILQGETSSPSAVGIEKELLEKYGVKAYLGNDTEAGKNILKAVEILKANNEKIPDEYIVTNFLIAKGEFIKTSGKNVALISSTEKMDAESMLDKHFAENVISRYYVMMPNFKKIAQVNDYWIKGRVSREDLGLHTALHESLHLGKGSFYPLKEKTNIPKKYIPAAREVSPYGYFTNPVELYTELRTKILMLGGKDKISKEEQDLFKYFQNLVG